jgi:hypothetical protein
MLRSCGRVLLLLWWPLIIQGAIPEFSLVRSSSLQFASADLATNGLPGLSNTTAGVTISGIPNSSMHGGRITIVSTQVWSRFFQGPSNDDVAYGIAIDAFNNVSVVGQSRRAGNNSDYLTLSYASDGTALWTNLYDGVVHGGDLGRWLGTDLAGNVIVSGEESVSFNAPTDVTTIKYSTQGVALWTNRFNAFGTNQHAVSAFATDAAGNAYVTAVTFGPLNPGYITIKYDAGGVPVWTNYFRLGANSSDHAADVAVDAEGSVFVAGGSSISQGPQGMVAIKYATDGSGVWTNFYPGLAMQGRELVLDDEGNVLVLGENGVGGGITHVYVLLKYSNAGLPLWTNILTGPLYQGGNVPQLFSGPNGSVYVLGGSPGGNGTDVDFTITKFSAQGTVVWTNRIGEPNSGNSAPGRGTLDRAGNFFLPYSAGLDLTKRDFVIVKYSSSDGASLWTNRFNGPAGSADLPAAAATDGWGAVYVAGYTRPTGGLWRCATVKFAEYFHYVPPPNFVGTDRFSFIATDNSGTSVTNSVNIHVRAEALWFNLSRSQLRHEENGVRRLHLNGAGVTGSVVLYASSNLTAWVPIATNVPSNDAVDFVIEPNGPYQFYRGAVVSP